MARREQERRMQGGARAALEKKMAACNQGEGTRSPYPPPNFSKEPSVPWRSWNDAGSTCRSASLGPPRLRRFHPSPCKPPRGTGRWPPERTSRGAKTSASSGAALNRAEQNGRGAARRRAAQSSAAQRSAAQRSAAQRSAAQNRTEQNRTEQNRTEQNRTAQHRTYETGNQKTR